MQHGSYRGALAALRPGLTAAAGFSAIISVLMLTGSVYMLQIYDRVLSSGSVPTLVALFGIVVVLYGFLAFYDGLRMRLLSRLAIGLDTRLSATAFRADLTEGLGAAEAAGARARTAGTFRRDLDMVRSFLGGPAMLALFDLPFTLIFLGVLFLIHPLLGFMTIGGMGLAAVLALANRRVLAEPLAKANTAEAAEQALAEAAKFSAASLAALGMAGNVTNRWQALHGRRLRIAQGGSEPSETLAALSRGLRMLLQSALLTAGAYLVLQGAMSAGAIVASSILSGRALAPVDQLIGQWRVLAMARTAHQRLQDGLPESRNEARNGGAIMDLPPLTGAVELQGVTRLAPPSPGQTEPRKVLDALTFRLQPGEGLGVVGSSASGKSTLAKMIVGATTPDAGEIRFDGATAQQWDRDLLGRQIGYLPQRVDLLPGSLRDNIARFDPNAEDADVIRAAEAAGVHEMILRLPRGYATDLSLGEVPLSGGQVQRIGLARALYGAPRLVVLDEPNAHLDMAGEASLTRALLALRKEGVTVIIMAHRAGALAAIDRLMVLDGGRILQDGPRDAVLSLLGAQSRAATVTPASIVTAPAPLSNAVSNTAAPPGTALNLPTAPTSAPVSGSDPASVSGPAMAAPSNDSPKKPAALRLHVRPQTATTGGVRS